VKAASRKSATSISKYPTSVPKKDAGRCTVALSHAVC
jgi:hypothetical protein